MARVIDLEAWRAHRELVVRPTPSDEDQEPSPGQERPIRRLEAAIARLESLVRSGLHRLGPRVESELLAITGAVSVGRVAEAADRAERLAERLEHPSSRLAR
ncbi:MAG TPA: hypothetical protein VFC04_05140 [Actinomycetota bacterium]|nr:hypothetical protein [Actinomycetota bacterium]